MNNPHKNGNRKSDVITSFVNAQGEFLEIYYHIDTGRLAARADDYEASGYHSGIVLGTDKYGNYWIAHNHYINRRPVIASVAQFCNGETFCFELCEAKPGNIKIAARALQQVMKGNAYHKLVYNSDDFIAACTERSCHTAVKKLSEGTLLLSALSLFLRIIE